MGMAGRNAARQVLARGRLTCTTDRDCRRTTASRCCRRRSTSARARSSQLDSFVPVGRLHHGRRVHDRRAGILRDPQRDHAVRPDADGQVPHRRAGRRCATSTAWSRATCASSRSTASATASGATTTATSSTTARCSAWRENEYRLCTAERQLDWLLDSAHRLRRRRSTRSPSEVAALALQGPTSCARAAGSWASPASSG